MAECTKPCTPHVIKGQGTLETAQIPYALLRDIFSSSFGIQDQDGAATARQKLENGILSQIGDEETATLYAHFIGHLIGLDYSTSPHLKGILGRCPADPQPCLSLCHAVFFRSHQERITVILLEDIHWADRGSLDFFDHLMSSKPDIPLLIVG